MEDQEKRQGYDPRIEHATDVHSGKGRLLADKVEPQGHVVHAYGCFVLCMGFLFNMSRISLNCLYLLVYNMEPLRVSESFRHVWL